MKTRVAHHDDIPQLCTLFNELAEGGEIGNEEDVRRVLDHPGTQISVACADPSIFSMATLHMLPNVTWAGRPYALIENVVTRSTSRGQGYGRAVLQHAIDTCESSGVYKVMLLTGRDRLVRGFYEKLGFSAGEKWGMTKRFS